MEIIHRIRCIDTDCIVRYNIFIKINGEELITDADVIFIDEPDLNREKALNIRLNNNSGDWDIGKLDTIFEDMELTGFDLTLTGFQTENLQPIETNNEIPSNETITVDITTGLKTENKKPEVTIEKPKTTPRSNETNNDNRIICPECRCEFHR